ncbi:MAG: SMP-30/gluconolactonase/LRE family protein [Acidimicrobiia bacterium]
MDRTPHVLLDGVAFPEGPRWRDGELWFSDFATGTVRSVDLAGTVTTQARIEGDNPSGIGFLPDGAPIVVSMNRRMAVRVDGDSLPVHGDLTAIGRDFLNDMLVDEVGRAYVGTRTRAMLPAVEPLSDEVADDTLVTVEPDGQVRVAASGLISPNGMVVTADGKALIVAETYAQRVSIFDRSSDGTLGTRRTFALTPGRYPDGICLDEEGAVWIGSPYSHEFIRVRQGGEITDVIAMPGGVACALGGPDGHTLFLLAVSPSRLPRITGASDEVVPPGGGCIATLQVDAGRAGMQ